MGSAADIFSSRLGIHKHKATLPAGNTAAVLYYTVIGCGMIYIHFIHFCCIRTVSAP